MNNLTDDIRFPEEDSSEEWDLFDEADLMYSELSLEKDLRQQT